MSENRNVPKLRFPEFSEKWSKSLLGEVVEITSASRVHKDEWTEHGVPFFRSSDVVAAFNGTQNTKAYISLELYNSLSKKIGQVKKGDLLITGGGTIGIPFLIRNDEPLYFKDADLLWIKNTKKTSGQFLYSFFTTPQFKKYLGSITHIGTIAHYTVVQAKNTPFRFPSLPEQQKIAEFLTAVDRRIELLQAKKKKLEAYKKGVMQKIFPSTGSGQVPQLRFKAYDGSEFPDWEERKLGEIIEILSDYTANGSFAALKESVQYFSEENYAALIRTTDLEKSPFRPERFTDKRGYDFLKKTKLFGGEIILANVGSIGKVYRVPEYSKPMTLAPNTYLLKFSKDVNESFIYQVMLTSDFTNKLLSQVGSSTLKAINKANLRSIPIQLPSLSEQSKIVAFLTSLDRSIENLNQQINQTQTWKKGLLQKMFV